MRYFLFLILSIYFFSLVYTYAYAEEYNGVQWGADFNSFEKIKKYKRKIGKPTNKITNTFDNWNICLAYLLGSPIKNFDGGLTMFGFTSVRPDMDCIPNKFNSVYIKDDDTEYIFWDNKFVMTFSPLKTENHDKIYDVLHHKYEIKEKVPLTTVLIFKDNKGFELKRRIKYTLFTGEHLNVFLIKKEELSSFGRFEETGLLYVPSKYYQLIKDEITQCTQKKRAREEENKEKALEKDLGKIK
jgi:hypothetical protein